MNKSFILGTVALAGLAACQSSSSSMPEPASPPASSPQGELLAGTEEILAAFSAKAVAAFRADGAAFRAGHLTHDVEVSDGIVELTPHHVDANAQRVTGGKLALRTRTIGTSDGSSLAGLPAGGDQPITTLADGVVEIQRGAAVETITNRADGVEQAWRFAARPGTAGDLTITVSTIGQTYTGRTKNGLHFHSDRGLGFRYSDAVWVEADGTRWPIEARYENSTIVMTVPEDVVANTVYPAVLDPSIQAEIESDTPVNGGAGVASTQAAIAFDGTNYLVVWEDRRLSIDSDIFGTRLSQSGTILDANNILIDASPGAQSHPVVAFAGGTFVVAWEDFKVSGGTEADIRAARVSTAGVVTPLGAVASTGASETDPAIAGSGGTAFLAWTVSSNIVGAQFNGTSFGGIVTVAGTTNSEIQPAVAGNGAGEFLVAWSENLSSAGDIRGAIVSGGTPGAAFDITTKVLRQFDPAASFDGTNYVVVWTDTSGSLNVTGGRVSQAGAPLDGLNGLPVTTAADSQEQPDVSCNSGGCVVVWRERRNFSTTSFDVFAQLMTTSFTPNGGEFVIANAGQPQQAPSVSTNGSNYFAVWHDERDARIKVVTGATVSSAGAVGAASPIPSGNNREFNPGTGHAGNFHMIAWSDSRSNDSSGVEFVRFNGISKLDVTSRTLSNAAFAQSAPRLSANGGSTLFAVWQDTRNGADQDIFGSKINSDGTVVTPAGKPIAVASGDQLVPVVSSAGNGGSAALVVWQDRRGANFDILGALLDANGNVVLNDIVICNAAGDQTRPSAAYDPVTDQWIVVWSDQRAGAADIFGARIALNGAVLDPNGVIVSGAAGSQFRPTIAFTGGVFLAVWEDRRSDNQGDIFGGRLQAGSSLTRLDGDGFGMGGTAGSQSTPIVANNVGSFLVVWEDSRDLATNGTDIYGIGIGLNGTVGEPEFTIATSTDNESSPAVNDSSATKTSRVAYVKQRPDLQTLRVVSRQVTVTSTIGNTCSQDSQCGAGGFCVDGRCCDSACGGTAVDCQACKSTLTGQPDGVCAPILAGKVCRPYADTFCDRQEKCDGVDLACPDDIGRREGVNCTIAGGGSGVCPPNDVTGAPHVCQ